MTTPETDTKWSWLPRLPYTRLVRVDIGPWEVAGRRLEPQANMILFLGDGVEFQPYFHFPLN